MKTHNNYNLHQSNTLGFDSVAREFYRVEEVADLERLHQTLAERPFLILGGGSNLVLPERIQYPVIQIFLQGIDILSSDEKSCLIKVAAGENWHNLVRWSVKQNLWGLENLSLIPGSTGAAPVQNIGAYGVEIKEVLEWVEIFDLKKGECSRLSNKQCQFEYRNSIFKQALSGKVIITNIALKLSKTPRPILHYGGLEALKEKSDLTALQVSDCICDIRRNKLPDPETTPNVGSFFKNPVVSKQLHSKLVDRFPEIVAYEQGEDWKLAAAWLIEQSGYKGLKTNHVGVHKKQALVLVHFGGGDASELLCLAREIQFAVEDKFGVHLEVEPRMVGEEQPFLPSLAEAIKDIRVETRP